MLLSVYPWQNDISVNAQGLSTFFQCIISLVQILEEVCNILLCCSFSHRRKCFSVISSVQSLSHVRFFATPWLQHDRLPCPSPTPRTYSNSCPSSRWCHPTISSTVVPFSSCLQSFPASGSFPSSKFFTSGGQSIVALVSLISWHKVDGQ